MKTKPRTKYNYMDGLTYGEWSALRKQICKRDRYTCVRCERKFAANYYKGLTVHHIIPRSKGGSNDPSNLISLCAKCHDYVEGEDLRNVTEIIGSYEEQLQKDAQSASNQINDNFEAFQRPAWHSWVYGGMPHPKIPQGRLDVS